MPMTIYEEYTNNQTKCGIHEGDYVRVTRKAQDNEDGWVNKWVDEMDNFIDCVGTVKEIYSNSGIMVHFEGYDDKDYYFPYFCMEKAGSLNEVSRYYKVYIHDSISGNIVIKCKNLNRIKEIILAAGLEDCQIDLFTTKRENI